MLTLKERINNCVYADTVTMSVGLRVKILQAHVEKLQRQGIPTVKDHALIAKNIEFLNRLKVLTES